MLEEKVFGIFHELDTKLGQGDIQACHRIKNNRTLIKLSNRKDLLLVLRAKKRLENLDGTAFNLPSDTKIVADERLCECYKGLWNESI